MEIGLFEFSGWPANVQLVFRREKSLVRARFNKMALIE
jgi:hypothetical protein